MKNPVYSEEWPESWKLSHRYDQIELFGDPTLPSYTYAYQERMQHTFELIEAAVEPGARILDVAAAQGNFSLQLAERGYEVTWNDLRADLIEYVQQKHEHGVVDYRAGNAFELSFDEKFDLVLIAEVIEHVAHPDQFLQKVSELVRPGGYIVMTTPNGEYIRFDFPRFSECANPEKYEEMQFKPNCDGHIFLLHKDEIDALAHKASLEVLETRFIINPLTNGHMKLGVLLKFLPRSIVNTLERLTHKLSYTLQRKLHNTTAVLMQKSQ